MPVEKETTIESFDRFKTVDSYKQNVGSLTDANMAMVPVPVQHLELTKADVNLANLTPEGKSYAAELGFFDPASIAIPITITNTDFTEFRPPCDGFLYLYINFKENTTCSIRQALDTPSGSFISYVYVSYAARLGGNFLPCKKGEYTVINNAKPSEDYKCWFLPLKGAYNA